MGFQPGRVGPETKLLSILHVRYISAEMSLKGSADITSIWQHLGNLIKYCWWQRSRPPGMFRRRRTRTALPGAPLPDGFVVMEGIIRMFVPWDPYVQLVRSRRPLVVRFFAHHFTDGDLYDSKVRPRVSPTGSLAVVSQNPGLVSSVSSQPKECSMDWSVLYPPCFLQAAHAGL